jgi:hypothetical protein
MNTNFWSGNMERRDHSQDVGIDERTTLRDSVHGLSNVSLYMGKQNFTGNI